MTIYDYDADTRIFKIRRRSFDNGPLIEFKDIDIYESNRIANAFDTMYRDGIDAGKEPLAREVIKLVERLVPNVGMP